ncbi:MAG: NAD(P)-dependent oxidoreductase [Dehalococcoidales bacterium]
MIIVTGAAGFVGRYLVDQLIKDGVEVLATARSQAGEQYYKKQGIPFINLDVSNEEDFTKLPKQGVEGVAHVAALLSIDIAQHTPKDYLLTNALGTYNVLEYCRKNNIKKIVYTMTHSDVNRAKEVIITEETPRQFGATIGLGNTVPFIVSKIAASTFIEVYDGDGLIQAIMLRLPGVRGYGSRDTYYNTVFHQFIQKAMKSGPIEIWGEHKTVRDLVYVKDVTAAISQALKSENARGLYNIGSGKGLTIEDEAKAIIKAFSPPGKPSPLVYRPDIEEVRKRSYVWDISKAKRELDWEPRYSYYEAMVDYKKEMERGYFK